MIVSVMQYRCSMFALCIILILLVCGIHILLDCSFIFYMFFKFVSVMCNIVSVFGAIANYLCHELDSFRNRWEMIPFYTYG